VKLGQGRGRNVVPGETDDIAMNENIKQANEQIKSERDDSNSTNKYY
jgi:hypothetical protein